MSKRFIDYYDHMTATEIFEVIEATYKTRKKRKLLQMRYIDSLPYRMILARTDKDYPYYMGGRIEKRKIEWLRRMCIRFEDKASKWLNEREKKNET